MVAGSTQTPITTWRRAIRHLPSALRQYLWDRTRGRDWATRSLLASSMFDVGYYAEQTGMTADPRRCVEHYLHIGFATGLRPNRLFDADDYLRQHADVAQSGMNPFVHFLTHGIAEGRTNQVPDSAIAHIAAMPGADLARIRLTHLATATGWLPGSPSSWA